LPGLEGRRGLCYFFILGIKGSVKMFKCGEDGEQCSHLLFRKIILAAVLRSDCWGTMAEARISTRRLRKVPKLEMVAVWIRLGNGTSGEN